MSFIAKLYLDDIEITLLSARLHITQNTDITGRPRSNPSGGFITIRMLSSYNGLLNEWMIDPNITKQGYIRFFKRDGYSRLVDWQFADCFCVSYHENFSSDGKMPMQTELVLSPGVLKVNKTVFNKGWGVTDLNSSINQGSTYISNSRDTKETGKEKQLVKYFISDINNNEISEFNIGDKIKLNILTENYIGETIDLELKNNTLDFSYMGKRLENDTLSGYIISSNKEEIELEVIEQQN